MSILRLPQDSLVSVKKELTLSDIKDLVNEALADNIKDIDMANERLDDNHVFMLAEYRFKLSIVRDFLDSINNIKIQLGKKPLI